MGGSDPTRARIKENSTRKEPGRRERKLSGLKPWCKKGHEKWLEASRTGHNKMNTEQIPKQGNPDADSVTWRRRLLFSVRRAIRSVTEKSGGVMVMACLQRNPGATRENPTCDASREAQHQLKAREGQIEASREVGEARSTDRSRVTPVEGRGLGLVIRQEEERTRRLA